MRTSLGLLAIALPALAQFESKIAPDLNLDQERVEVIVQYKEDRSTKTHKFARLQRVRERGGELKSSLDLINADHYTNLSASAVRELANDPDVLYVTPNRAVYPSLDITAGVMNAPTAWNMSLNGAGIGIAVIDSGVSAHDDLKGRILDNKDFTGQNVTTDQFGHGTAVAAILAGNAKDSTGSGYTRNFKGVAPGASILNLRVLNSNGAGTDAAVIAAINYAISHAKSYSPNIKVINLSLGRGVFGSYKTDPLCQAAEAAWKAGIVVVVAAGNLGRVQSQGINGYGTINAPGNDPYVITVGAMKALGSTSRADSRMATYSSKGPTLFDHVVKPDLVAPGSDIVTAKSPDVTGSSLWNEYPVLNVMFNYYFPQNGTAPSNNYFQISGTSMATPVVSGAVALLLQQNGSLKPDQVKARLMKTATKNFPASSTVTDTTVNPPVTYTTYYDPFTVGAGYLDIGAAANSSYTIATTKNAQSPSAVYTASSDTGTFLFPAGSAIGFTAGATGSSVIWGTNVTPSSVIWGTSVTWGTSVIWGTSDDGGDGFSVLWGTSGINPASVIWGTSVTWGTNMKGSF